jgi:hypothetical protein
MLLHMPDSRAIDAEHPLQPLFMKMQHLQALSLAAAIMLAHLWIRRQPDRVELGPRVASVHFTPVALPPEQRRDLRIVGTWSITSGDPRFGGISALAVDAGKLLALTDSGVIVRFGKPGTWGNVAHIDELPGGPHNPRQKLNRDSEALTLDPGGRGWWVAFENRNELWLYDPAFKRALRRVKLPKAGLKRNRGIEGMTSAEGNLLLFPEPGSSLWEQSARVLRLSLLPNRTSAIADAVGLPEGGLLVLERSFGPLGFANVLAEREPRRGGYRLVSRTRLPLGPLDNAEAIAAEPRPGGGVRLWIMTDDNLQPPLRTLLVAIDRPAG